ncbi:membrane cofactor protein-like [Rhinophrynus dorsalis]
MDLCGRTCRPPLDWSSVPEALTAQTSTGYGRVQGSFFLAPGTCDSPPRLAYGELKPEFSNQSTFDIGATVQYNCRPGYIRNPGTNNTITCLDNSTWSTPDEFCRRISCGPPGDTPNGQVEIEDTLFGSRANYTCDPGYNMISRYNYRECQADGTWSNSVPVCEVQICPPPHDITNGSYSPQKDEYQYQDSVTFTCNKDLFIVGESSIFCTAAGNWSAVEPHCKAVECSNPVVPNSKKTSGFVGPYTLNSAVGFECLEGFTMNGSSIVKCNINSEWEPSLPQCLKTCDSPPRLTYGELKPEFSDQNIFYVGQTVQYNCRPGYIRKLGTNNTITCLDNSSWSTPDEFCETVNCPDPVVPNSKKTSGFVGPYTLNSAVGFECLEGFKMNGPSTVKCNINSEWEPSLPQCLSTTATTQSSPTTADGDSVAAILGNAKLILAMLITVFAVSNFL